MRLKTNFVLILLVFFSILTTLQPNTLKAFALDVVKYEGEVAHLFTHCLIAYPELAFKDNNFMRHDYDKDCLTTYEFNNILKGLYDNDYILVKISQVYEVKDDKAYKKTLLLPYGLHRIVVNCNWGSLRKDIYVDKDKLLIPIRRSDFK